jgi:LPS export ABC transporter permease LptG/LPS export ABC transporter permease LptF
LHRISRYVFREILSPSLLGIALYTFVLLMNVIFQVAELAIKKDLPLIAILRILALSLPQILALTIPMSVLLGVLIGVGRLSSDSELTALRACGISYRKVILPILALGTIGWVVCSALVHWVEPKTNYLRHRITSRLFLQADPRKDLKPRVFFEDLPGMLLYADKVARRGESLERILLYQTDPDGRELLTSARRGRLDYDPKTGRFRLLLESASTHRSDPSDPVAYQVYGAERQMVQQEADSGFKLRLRLLEKPQPKSYREQSLRELAESWRQAEGFQHIPTRARIRNAIDVIRQERFALPLACIVFSLVGFPLGIYNRRGGKSSGVALSLGVVLVYWILLSLGQNLATEGKVSPFVGLWTGNILFTLVGTLLILKRERRESGDPGAWIGRVHRMTRRVRGFLRDRWRGRRERRRTERARRPWDEASEEPSVRPAGGAPFASLIDRYVLRSFTRFFLITGISIYIIFLVVDFRGLVDDIIQNQVPGAVLFGFFKYRTPWMASQILPVACLVASLLSFGVMARFNEITALKAGGVSLYRVSIPVLAATGLLSVFAFYVQGYVLPFSNQKASQLRDVIRGRPVRTYTQPQRRWIPGDEGVFYNFRNYTHPPASFLPLQGRGVFQGFTVYRMDPGTFELESRTYAREARHLAGKWKLVDGWDRTFAADGTVVSFEPFAEREFPEAERVFRALGEIRTPDQMSFWQLKDFIRELRRRGDAVQELSVDLHEKLALPFVSIVMVILGLPFAFRAGKRGSLYGIGLSIGLVVVYYSAFAVTSALGAIGLLPPFLAAWAPNILFAGAGTYLMLSVVQT